ncbi:MAG: Stp1/IreP family PP2C-type Ser/Thr phosphatase [Planctomycetes bacterium]|nr:Stp1/IreP family PP2C-type Ser/Thr phosphatase [Planctomycetota bacterium]
MAISIIAKTDVGQRREKNEDNFLVRQDRGLCVVTDGMGGHLAGEIASSIAVRTIEDLCEQWPGESPAALEARQRADTEFLLNAISRANFQIYTKGASHEELREMGTTIVAGVFRDRYAVIASVGDSRVYRWRRGRLTQLTDDHSWVGELLQKKLLSREEAMYHPLKNIITRALGMAEEVAIDYRVIDLESADIFLFCTDGLTDLVTDDELTDILASDLPLTEKADELVNTANDAGGFDNITVGLVGVTR